MSGSRRRRKLPKCICGRHMIPHDEKKLRHVLGCPSPLYEDMRRVNAEFQRYRRARWADDGGCADG